jgi:tetratricopeptide (TPR) repeat protein
LQLAEMHAGKENFKQAEEVLKKALEVSGGEVNVRERLEDMQLRNQRTQIDIAKKKATEEKTPEAVELYKKLKAELNNMELSVYRTRCDRYPANMGLKYELGLRLQRAKMYKEAIQAFQGARADPQRKGLVLVGLGECFHEIKQHQLAISHFEQAIQELTDRDDEAKKWSLYCAGRLLLAAKDLDKAEKYLSELAGRDFSYKDVAECLDKIRQLRDKG